MTDLAATYRYADFTHEAYARLLDLAKASYPFRGYGDFDRTERFLLWRHDVDASMHEAVTLARMEAKAGVTATYFLLPGCMHYNLFEPAIVACMREIRALGHHFGLHFHITHEHSPEAIEASLAKEKRLLEEYCERPITAFSYHNPSSFALSLDAERYAGMVNSYARYFRDEVAYCSDSNGIWRHANLEETLRADHPRLQVLTHPEWWTREPMSPRARMARCIDGRARHTLAAYNQALFANDRPNICELDAEFRALDAALGEKALPIQMLWLRGEKALALSALQRATGKVATVDNESDAALEAAMRDLIGRMHG